MLYIFYGTDREKILTKSDMFSRKLFEKDAGLSFEKFDADSFDVESVRSLAGSQSLFGSLSLILIDSVLETHEMLSTILPILASSDHTFIIREGSLTKAELKPFEKHAEKVEFFEKKEEKKPVFNIFAFTDAISERNKKQAWILYQKALASGMAAEEIFWKVVWQIKTMLLVEKTKNAIEAGINPFVFSKAKGNLRRFAPGELETLSQKLVLGYHNARRGKGEIETFIEKILLKL